MTSTKRLPRFITTGTACALMAYISLLASTAQAAFIIEAHSSGKANATNFSFGGDTTTASASAASAARGLTGTSSIFGGNGTLQPDTYVFSYTPGTDVDNTVFVPGTILGSTTGFPGQGNVSTGLPGGAAGQYNVYFTAPASTNVDASGSDFLITQNGAPLDIQNVVLNNGGTGPDTDPGAAFVGGANNAWFLLGTVNLLPGNTYRVTQAANTNSFVSQRAHAVMFEVVPEPTTATYLASVIGLGAIAFFARSCWQKRSGRRHQLCR
jgi:hypothetical protein